MPIDDYEQAVRTINDHPELADFEGPKDSALVERAERELGVVFPAEYRRFLLELGAGSFGGTEIYGVIHGDFRHSGIPDAIWNTLNLRDNAELPDDLVAFYSVGEGEELCVRVGDGSVVAVVPGSGEVAEVVSPDFGVWFAEAVTDEVDASA